MALIETWANAQESVDVTWTLVAGCLVFLMQGGFAYLEGGFTRAKNVSNIMMKNLMDFSFGSVAYFFIGFGIMFGAATEASGAVAWGGLGHVIGTDNYPVSYDPYLFELFFFQVMFAQTATTIVSGSMAERTLFKGYVLYSIAISTIIYPVFGHWVWGGGWLANGKAGEILGLGSDYVFWDFAGSTVVHGVGGLSALMGAWVLGPRVGKYKRDGTPMPIPGHNIPYSFLGAFLLWFGWFGFNAGSTLAATPQVTIAIVNTNQAAASGAIAAIFYTWHVWGIPDPSYTVNGCIAGLVAITAPCAFVSGLSAHIIGFIGGIQAPIVGRFVETRLKIDDVVGAFAVHGTGGIWGGISVGIFSNGEFGGPKGILYGDAGQLTIQIFGVIVLVLFVLPMAFIVFTSIKHTIGLRAPLEDELLGLDRSEHGLIAYPEFSYAETAPSSGGS